MSEAPTKPCHNCRRQRLRCDRSFPHCNKCASLGKECLGYGKLFRWTGAVASRGKLAGRTSSAPVSNNQIQSHTSTSWSTTGSPSANSSPSTPSPPGCDMQQLVKVKSPTSSVEADITSPYILVDPLFQDLGPTHRYYLSYCKRSPPIV